jgi:hypothetical protein
MGLSVRGDEHQARVANVLQMCLSMRGDEHQARVANVWLICC